MCFISLAQYDDIVCLLFFLSPFPLVLSSHVVHLGPCLAVFAVELLMLPVHYSTMKPPRTSVGFDVCLLTTRVSDCIALHIFVS